MRVIALIQDPAFILRILEHLARWPPRRPGRLPVQSADVRYHVLVIELTRSYVKQGLLTSLDMNRFLFAAAVAATGASAMDEGTKRAMAKAAGRYLHSAGPR